VQCALVHAQVKITVFLLCIRSDTDDDVDEITYCMERSLRFSNYSE